MNIQKFIRIAGTLTLLAVAVQADWNPGDPYKMHYPQLPDPTGWDVSFSSLEPTFPGFGKTLADDFRCTESGEITDVHFWVSWRYDQFVWDSIRNIHLSIHSDNPMGPYGWSQPDQLLWEMDFLPGQFTYRPEPQFSGPQGWFDPDPLQGYIVEPFNHFETWQINVTDILNPFYQVEGKVYWLDIRIDQFPGLPGEIGWKTSIDHFNDDAVVDIEPIDPLFNDWWELRDPFTGESLDLAFVIVPEPNVLAMILATGGGFLFVRRTFMI